MNECPADHVMNIQSAVAGFTSLYNPNANPIVCPGRNCTKPIPQPAALCNGKRTCRIRQQVLLFGKDSALCVHQKDGNFIEVIFTCVHGTTSIIFSIMFGIAYTYINVSQKSSPLSHASFSKGLPLFEILFLLWSTLADNLE